MKYRKKPIVIEAIQWTGDNKEQMQDFAGEYAKFDDFGEGEETLMIKTIEGTLQVPLGHYVIRGVKNDYYPIDEDIFYESYEKVEG